MKKVTLTREISEKQYEWRNNPSIHAWTRQNGLLAPTDMEKWKKRIAEDSSILMFGIEAFGENVGTCGLTSISQLHGTAEFSLLIGPEHQRKGYGEAALIELLKYAFNNLRLHCIWGETFEGNPAYELFLKLGMKPEGVCRERYFKSGKYVNTIIVSILESEARMQPWLL